MGESPKKAIGSFGALLRVLTGQQSGAPVENPHTPMEAKALICMDLNTRSRDSCGTL